MVSTLRSYLMCTLLLNLAAASCATTSVERFEGTWKLDIERTVALSSQLQRLIADDPNAFAEFQRLQRIGWFEFQGGQARIYDGSGPGKTASYRVVKHSPQALIIDSMSEQLKSPRRMIVTFLTDTTIELNIPDQRRRIVLQRPK